jgi:hypothetical protein
MKVTFIVILFAISLASIYGAGNLRGAVKLKWTNANIAEGLYKIKTTYHKDGKQPAGWGLSAWHGHGGKRNSHSSWVYVHDGDKWPMIWKIVKGKKPNTYRLLTTSHKDGPQQANWGLSAWHAHGAARNSHSSWTAVHDGDKWPMDWQIVKGKHTNTYRLLTTSHGPGSQKAGWGLSAWHAHGAVRNKHSSRVAVHDGDHWPMDWTFERVDKPKPDPCLNCKNEVKTLKGKVEQVANEATKASTDLANAKKQHTSALNGKDMMIKEYQNQLQASTNAVKATTEELAETKEHLKEFKNAASTANIALTAERRINKDLVNDKINLQSKLLKSSTEMSSLATRLSTAKEESTKFKTSYDSKVAKLTSDLAMEKKANENLLNMNMKQKQAHGEKVAKLQDAHQVTKDHHAQHVDNLHEKHENVLHEHRVKSGFTIASIANDRDHYKEQVVRKMN